MGSGASKGASDGRARQSGAQTAREPRNDAWDRTDSPTLSSGPIPVRRSAQLPTGLVMSSNGPGEVYEELDDQDVEELLESVSSHNELTPQLKAGLRFTADYAKAASKIARKLLKKLESMASERVQKGASSKAMSMAHSAQVSALLRNISSTSPALSGEKGDSSQVPKLDLSQVNKFNVMPSAAEDGATNELTASLTDAQFPSLNNKQPPKTNTGPADGLVHSLESNSSQQSGAGANSLLRTASLSQLQLDKNATKRQLRELDSGQVSIDPQENLFAGFVGDAHVGEFLQVITQLNNSLHGHTDTIRFQQTHRAVMTTLVEAESPSNNTYSQQAMALALCIHIFPSIFMLLDPIERSSADTMWACLKAATRLLDHRIGCQAFFQVSSNIGGIDKILDLMEHRSEKLRLAALECATKAARCRSPPGHKLMIPFFKTKKRMSALLEFLKAESGDSKSKQLVLSLFRQLLSTTEGLNYICLPNGPSTTLANFCIHGILDLGQTSSTKFQREQSFRLSADVMAEELSSISMKRDMVICLKQLLVHSMGQRDIMLNTQIAEICQEVLKFYQSVKSMPGKVSSAAQLQMEIPVFEAAHGLLVFVRHNSIVSWAFDFIKRDKEEKRRLGKQESPGSGLVSLLRRLKSSNQVSNVPNSVSHNVGQPTARLQNAVSIVMAASRERKRSGDVAMSAHAAFGSSVKIVQDGGTPDSSVRAPKVTEGIREDTTEKENESHAFWRESEDIEEIVPVSSML